ncbi:relaxase/mobilization nuclease domain-containing protein [Ensifer sp. SL37]|uniref:relaxase/mobilization nuclease domain-containing protein n=1 Tax=Ensifer sp. SL37 TaxID=2995137 RepID=UPI002272E8DD|nr:relaxase/mobilization nuclease domain-containing protein [Ensifer sp. SL37]MCY1741013.1 relaxase/mobilization nuclease domain-containing protein [Ensifer sp. SL37]
MSAPEPFVIGRFKWAKTRGRPDKGGSNLARQFARASRVMRAAGNLRALPQVMFKVARNGGCKGVLGLTAQLDYVLGKAEHIIDPNKQLDRLSHLPSEFSKVMAKEWAEGWDRRVSNGHSMHMIASFPRGTDPEKVAEIIRATTFDLLDQGRSRFTYIAAVHTDKGHPHAHIIVDRRNAEGEWFYFARDGEFTYDRFKHTMVEHAAALGVELVNSSRLSRGLTPAEAERNPHAARRGLAGTLVAHGAAPYQHKPNERMSYHVTVATPAGEKTLWGKDLAPVIRATGAVGGDAIRITHEGKQAVQVTTRDGKVIETHRNKWAVELPERQVSATSAEFADPTPAAPTVQEQQNAEWARSQILAHAAEYRAFAEAHAGSFPALAKGFQLAADLLETGQPLTAATLEDRRSIDMPDGHTIASETDKALSTIDQARTDLMAVREAIPQLAPQQRPEVETKYFEAVRDVERLTNGVAAAEYTEPAHGTIYAGDRRGEVAALGGDQLARALEGTGIAPDEVAARAAVEVRTAALEAHWVESDARSIAAERGYDMTTEEGSNRAYQDLVATYQEIGEHTRTAELARPLAVEQPELVDLMEERTSHINEARGLAQKDTLTPVEQDRLIELVEKTAGTEAAQELRGGNVDALSSVIADKSERFDVAEKFLQADQTFGHDRADAIEAVQKGREATQISQQLEERRALQQQSDLVRERQRDSGLEL